jgi:2-keto-4-pentenoate hydratase
MNNLCHIATIISLAILLNMPTSTALAQAQIDCSVNQWSADMVTAWQSRSMLSNEMTACYAGKITSMDMARDLRDQVIAAFDELLPRAAYKVVGLDPVNAALDGVDRPMVGVMYVSHFLPDGATISLNSARMLITEPDILFRVSDSAINDATTLEEALVHIDRVYAFIEVPAPLFNNNPPNPFLMQASNLLPRWGVIGQSMAVENTPEFLRSLETMQVSFIDGDEQVLAEEPGSYLGGNPLNGVLVVLDELRRKGKQLREGDLISSGSYMPPILVTSGMFTKTVYEGIGGQTLEVSASYE